MPLLLVFFVVDNISLYHPLRKPLRYRLIALLQWSHLSYLEDVADSLEDLFSSIFFGSSAFVSDLTASPDCLLSVICLHPPSTI